MGTVKDSMKIPDSLKNKRSLWGKKKEEKEMSGEALATKFSNLVQDAFECVEELYAIKKRDLEKEPDNKLENKLKLLVLNQIKMLLDGMLSCMDFYHDIRK